MLAPLKQLRRLVGQGRDERQLMLEFEAIGADCEFGLVQRHYGAEPLGLLRFNAAAYDGLMAAISHRFEGMGEARNTEMIVFGRDEYLVRDRRWGLGMHTFKFVGQVDPDSFYAKFCQRIVYLRDKLLADFAEARKTFVYYAPDLERADVHALHAALRTLGPVSLLHVTTLEQARDMEAGPAPGMARMVAPDLYVGWLGRRGRTAADTWDIAFDDWLSICRNVRAIRPARRSASAN